ncbi:MAG TPA: ATP-binding protein [Polyangiaceae bacterium]
MNNGDALLGCPPGFGSGARLAAADSAARLGQDQAQRLESALLRELVQQLQAQERSRAVWTAQVVHELKRPLTTIDLAAQMLEEDTFERAESTRERLAHIRWAVKALAALTSDLLDASCVEARALKLELAKVRIAGLVRDAIAHLPDLANRCLLRVEPYADMVLNADSRRIEQVLANLLDNAATYGCASSNIDIDVVRQAGQVRVTVSSRGPGIAADRLPRVFERFERGESAGLGKPGLGLGLYIAKAIIEAHGGRIWATSAPSVITQFYFTLPLPTARPPRMT